MLANQWNDLIVPGELVAFSGPDLWMVVNPKLATWTVSGKWEFWVLQALQAKKELSDVLCRLEADYRVSKSQLEKALAKLLLKRIIFLPSALPKIPSPDIRFRSVYYAITEGCNLRCPYCYASAESARPNELTTEDAMELVREISAMGVEELVFTGGEPLLRRDVFNVAGLSRALGLRTNIITNGTLIKTKSVAARIASTFDLVTVSVDGGSAETHERTRGKGTFKVVKNALSLLNAEGVQPKINHVITHDNVDDLPSFADFVAQNQIRGVNLMNHGPQGRGASDGQDLLWSDYLKSHEYVWTSSAFSDFAPDGPELPPCGEIRMNCGMGGNEIYVNSIGDAFPCKLVTGVQFRAGNIRKTRLSEIYESPVFRNLRSSSIEAGRNLTDCANCYVSGICGGGCRAYHLGYTGRIWSNSPGFCRVLRHSTVASMWASSGISSSLLLGNTEMYVPICVADGSIHSAFEDWKHQKVLPLSLIA